MMPVVKNIPEYPAEIIWKVGLDGTGPLDPVEYSIVLFKWSDSDKLGGTAEHNLSSLLWMKGFI